MTYEVKVSKEILNIFSENQSKRYQEIILYKLKEYLMHNFYRIKRVDAPVK
ncbi:hypothetical protein [Enterococcus spodopteracolus]|nr:hypothetical protein [Enterococcus spodopteracolus]